MTPARRDSDHFEWFAKRLGALLTVLMISQWGSSCIQRSVLQPIVDQVISERITRAATDSLIIRRLEAIERRQQALDAVEPRRQRRRLASSQGGDP